MLSCEPLGRGKSRRAPVGLSLASLRQDPGTKFELRFHGVSPSVDPSFPHRAGSGCYSSRWPVAEKGSGWGGPVTWVSGRASTSAARLADT